MKPLQDLKIVSVEQFGAAPYGTMLLAELGATVIKIENAAIGGDPARKTGPYYLGENDSEYFQSFNSSKKSVVLDLRSEEGRAALNGLIAKADVVMNNLRGDLPAKMGLDYPALSSIKSSIVCVHISAYGRDNERTARPGYDYLMQAEAGYLSVTGEPDGPPARMGLSIVDFMTGLMTVFAMTSAIIGARASGRGQDVDVSLFDTALHNLSYLAVWYLNGGHVQGREPRSGHPSLTPSQLYRTRDGWIFIMINKENFWAPLCEAIGRPEWVHDGRFATFKARLENRMVLNRQLDEALSARTTSEWMTVFAGKVPAAPVLDIKEALDNPFVAEREGVRTFEGSPHGAPLRMVASPIRIPGEELPARAAPGLGADTEDILSGIGLTAEQVAELRRRGIV